MGDARFEFRQIPLAGFKAGFVAGLAGSEKALFDAIVCDGYDVVFLPDASPASLAKMARLGIPCIHSSMISGYAVPQSVGSSAAIGNGVWAVDPMLSWSMLPVVHERYSVTVADVEQYAEASGDTNRIHFDDGYAVALGFEGRISHGMLFNGWVSKYLGTRFPGEGTLYLRNSNSYFAPVYPGKEYLVRISVPSMDGQRGLFKVLFQLIENVSGTDKKLVMLSYNDVMLRRPSI